MLLIPLQNFNEDTERLVNQNKGEINILVDNGNLFKGDLELFFGPLEDKDTFVVVKEGTLWSHVLAGVGCFPSISQARKNGWSKEIEPGFTPTFKVGKAKRKFFTAFRPTSKESGKGLSFSQHLSKE